MPLPKPQLGAHLLRCRLVFLEVTVFSVCGYRCCYVVIVVVFSLVGGGIGGSLVFFVSVSLVRQCEFSYVF